MKTLFGQTIFVVAEHAYGWEDVVLFAQLRGEWAELETRTWAGLACRKRLAAEGGTLNAREIEAAANEFRYARDLVSAQNTTDWLARWGLTVKNWMEYMRREHLRARWAAELPATLERFPPTNEEVAANLKAEAVCSGQLTRMAKDLAFRAAAAERTRQELTVHTEPAPEAEPQTAIPSVDFEAAAWPGLTEDSFRQKIAHLAWLEGEFRPYEQRLLTPKAIREQVQSHGLDWIKLSAAAVSFDSEAAAREAVLCVRQDGMSLAEIATEAQLPLRQGVFYLDQIGGTLKDLLLAQSGGVLSDPVPEDDRFTLYLVVEKVAPTERDPEIQRRAVSAILQSARARDVNEFVQWRQTLR